MCFLVDLRSNERTLSGNVRRHFPEYTPSSLRNPSRRLPSLNRHEQISMPRRYYLAHDWIADQNAGWPWIRNPNGWNAKHGLRISRANHVPARQTLSISAP